MNRLHVTWEAGVDSFGRAYPADHESYFVTNFEQANTRYEELASWNYTVRLEIVTESNVVLRRSYARTGG